MTAPGLAATAGVAALGYAHIALTVGSRADVEALTERLRGHGVRVISGPRQTGDGYFESVVADPDGNEVEITADVLPASVARVEGRSDGGVAGGVRAEERRRFG